MKAIVCGGRDFDNYRLVGKALKAHEVDLVIHGNAPGADRLAAKWAWNAEVPALSVPARWRTGGRGGAEGPIRNSRMLEMALEMGVTHCIAFPGGSGTADMTNKAAKAGLEVVRVTGA